MDRKGDRILHVADMVPLCYINFVVDFCSKNLRDSGSRVLAAAHHNSIRCPLFK